MRAVNLLPRAEARRSVKGNLPVITGVVGAARAELALVPPPAAKQSSAGTELAGEESQRVAALQTALDGRIAWDRVLREVSLVLPSDVWLSAMTLTAPDPGTTAGQGFSIAGSTYSHDSVAR